ncbi:MAG: S-methyl-5-thioribose-1-phosphate isomerase [Candidatus Cloacimonetes bacterium]|nr:S-methyl-5-thioribose-1-phosphate isomerase [Candidatus Cloacimonadota bacterium]
MNKIDICAIWSKNEIVFIIDQTKLPSKLEILKLSNFQQTAAAIKEMKLRGAGTIGVAAGFAMAQAFSEFNNPKQILDAKKIIENTRPTAQNLFYATNLVYQKSVNSETPKETAWKTAHQILERDIKNSKIMGKIGAKLIKDGDSILTHCNAGKLAIAGLGSALAPIYTAHNQGRKIFVYVDETRPRLQGSKITAWELSQAGIPHSIIVDNAAGFFMQKGKIDIIFVGADRIAKNGDLANKIGTYEKAVLAKENNIPFYVVAPTSTIDIDCQSGNDIIIEERSQDEVMKINGKYVANKGSKAFNPAFDITPAKYITGIITEKGIIQNRKYKTKNEKLKSKGQKRED